MLIKKLELKNFMRHDSTTLSFPERGVVVVTGPNGAGKSSLGEAVAWTLWGETMRRKPPYRVGVSAKAPCIASLETYDGLQIERSRKGGATTKLSFLKAGEVEVEAATTSKEQDRLESLIGAYNPWRHSHAFSSSDAARLTEASDKERKLLLEHLALDGARFDAALQKCRVELKAAEARLTEAKIGSDRSQERVDTAIKRKKYAEDMLASLPSETVTIDPKRIAELRAAASVTREEAQEMQAVANSLRSQGGRSGGEIELLQRRLSKLGSANSCDACGQAVPHGLRAELEKEIRARKSEIEIETGALNKKINGYSEGFDDALDRLNQIKNLLTALERKESEAARFKQVKDKAEAEAADADKFLKDSLEAKARHAENLPELKKQVALLEAAERVLGLRGVRSVILNRTLKSIELSANAWLPRIGASNLKVKLTPTVETKSGVVNDAIGFEVEGAGGGYGYLAASSGERRRIDVAVLLALSDVACIARGKAPGTLLLDEVADALDEEGTEVLAQVLKEIGKERPVIVVSHNLELLKNLKGSLHWHVDGGKVTVNECLSV